MERKRWLKFEAAMLYATRLHASQHRKGTKIPYIAHLLGVTSIVLEHGGNEDEATAALLHDAIEDGKGDATRRDIRRRFGRKVAEIVEGCTDTDQIPKPPWRPRKEAYIARLGQESNSVLLVSAADKLHNARAILADYRVHGESLWKRFNGGRDTLWYYGALVRVFMARKQHSALVEELARIVSNLTRLTSI